jgi:hypothetical protein
MVRKEEALRRIGDLFGSQRLGVLATEGNGVPHTSLVAFACTEDLRKVSFGTTRASRKYTNILENPSVSMLIDDRRNDVNDFKDAVAVTIRKKAREPSGEERDSLIGEYMERHSYLGDFASSPTIAFMVIDVEAYNLVSRFQRVLELRMDD